MKLPKTTMIWQPTKALIPYARNARRHSEEQIAIIAASFKEFGFLNPIIVDDTNTIIAGHGRFFAALKLDLPEVATINAAHLTKAQRQAYGIIDNQSTDRSEWDQQKLKNEYEDLSENGFDTDLLGFTQVELDIMTAKDDQFVVNENKEDEWKDMPEYEDHDPFYRKIIVNFDCEEHVQAFAKLLNQEITTNTKSIWFPYKERNNLKDLEYVDSKPS